VPSRTDINAGSSGFQKAPTRGPASLVVRCFLRAEHLLSHALVALWGTGAEAAQITFGPSNQSITFTGNGASSVSVSSPTLTGMAFDTTNAAVGSFSITALSFTAGPQASNLFPASANTETFTYTNPDNGDSITETWHITTIQDNTPQRHRLSRSWPWSPPLVRRNMRHVWNAEGFVAFHRSVDDIHRVAAQHQVDERSAGTLPPLDLVLAHGIDEIVLLA
jgi:hypothetical protein